MSCGSGCCLALPASRTRTEPERLSNMWANNFIFILFPLQKPRCALLLGRDLSRSPWIFSCRSICSAGIKRGPSCKRRSQAAEPPRAAEGAAAEARASALFMAHSGARPASALQSSPKVPRSILLKVPALHLLAARAKRGCLSRHNTICLSVFTRNV